MKLASSFSIFLYCFLISSSFKSNVNATVSGCAFSGALQVESSLWVEVPPVKQSLAQWTTYYAQLRAYITSNCVNTAITKVIIRTINPVYGGTVLWPPKTSPLMTQFFRTLPGGIQVSFYPYLYDDADRAAWINYGGSRDVIENVFIFAKGWNDYLKSVESARRVTAITLDLGELGPRNIYQVPITPAKITAYKTKYGIPELGGLVSFDDKVGVTSHVNVLDQIYLLVSGLYFPSVNVDKSETKSPFMVYRNDPVAMAKFVIANVFLPGIKNTFLPYVNRLTAMWSTQSAYGKCLYPNVDGSCQPNYEFGTWTADNFNAFIRQTKVQSPDFLGRMQHGSFQFNHIPVSWVPSTGVKPATTPAPGVTTVRLPLTNTAASGVSVKGCEVYGASTVNGFLWAETPNSVNSMAQFVKFFAGMRAYVTNNCVNIRFTKLIIRVPTPLSYPGVFTNPKTSPMYTQLIASLPSYTSINILPYVMTDNNRLNWVNYSGSRDVVESVFIFCANWNSFLRNVGSAIRIKGITLDLEEIKPSAKYSMAMSVRSIAGLKAAYGITEFGAAIGYDDRAKFALTHFDEFYLQFYDFYQPYRDVDKSKTDSRFNMYKNDPVAMAKYITGTILAPAILRGYQGQEPKLNAMWSLQSTKGQCIYPLDNGTCYNNYEFGVWRPDTFNAFLRKAIDTSPALANMNHGMFQYSFTPLSWLPYA